MNLFPLTAMERLKNIRQQHKRSFVDCNTKNDAVEEEEEEEDENEEENMSDDDSQSSGDNNRESESEYRKGGYHPVMIGDNYHNGRYIIEKKLGFGYFSTVWLASDQTKNDTDPHKVVAIKISKSKQSFQEASQDEMKFLQTIGCNDFIVQLLDQFVIWGPNGKHYCLVFEPMWKDLYFLIRKFNYKGLPLKLLKVIAYQILCGVEYMHRKHIIHTDIKPENFLLSLPYDISYETLCKEREQYLLLDKQLKSYERSQQPAHTLSRNQRRRMKEKEKQKRSTMDLETVEISSPSQASEIHQKLKELEKLKAPPELNRNRNLIVKVADFGNACWTHKHYTSDITTRQYRSPEALLGYPYGTPVDLFACGAMIFELATGDILFQPDRTHDPYRRNENHLTLMYRTMGNLPRHMIKEGKYSEHYFNRKCEFRHYSMDSLEPRPLDELLKHCKYESNDAPVFIDFLSHLLEPDPQKRWTATQSKQHPWLSDVHSAYMSQGLKVFSLE